MRELRRNWRHHLRNACIAYLIFVVVHTLVDLLAARV